MQCLRRKIGLRPVSAARYASGLRKVTRNHEPYKLVDTLVVGAFIEARSCERFEAVVSGMELANAFSELNDAEEQARRFAMQESERAAGDAEAEPGDPDYVEAMSYGMPPNGGCGVGIDRLAMVLSGRDTIRDVILFPALRPRD